MKRNVGGKTRKSGSWLPVPVSQPDFLRSAVGLKRWGRIGGVDNHEVLAVERVLAQKYGMNA